MRFRPLATRSLTNLHRGDGQEYTALVRRIIRAHLALGGLTSTDWHINEVAWRKDGGVDGLIEKSPVAPSDSYFTQKTVIQLKANDTKPSDATKELTEEPKDEKSVRVKDKIEQGYQLAWFVGGDLPATKRQELLDAIRDTVRTINPKAPEPMVYDDNNLCDLLCSMPGALASVVNMPQFSSIDRKLKEPVHEGEFVSIDGFKELVQRIQDFSRQDSSNLLHFFGTPGIGKTRRILEAVKAIGADLQSTCYFSSTDGVVEFLRMVDNDDASAFIIIDEYSSEAELERMLKQGELGANVRAIAIGHSDVYARQTRDTIELKPYSDKEIVEMLRRADNRHFPGTIATVASYAKGCVRLARLLLKELDPSSPIVDTSALVSATEKIYDRIMESKPCIRRLALVPYLRMEHAEAFCEVVGLEPSNFLSECVRVSQDTEFIKHGTNVSYVSIPAIGDMALLDFYNKERAQLEKILRNPGEFGGDILTRIKDIVPEDEGKFKQWALSFFELKRLPMSISELADPEIGQPLMTLLQADPTKYIPLIHALITNAGEELLQLPYDTYEGIGRRNLIWALQPVAMYEEWFDKCEEVVFELARHEAPTQYANTATSEWAAWYRAWFCHTGVSMDHRYDILERRASGGEPRDLLLVARAIRDPFPRSSISSPQKGIAGRPIWQDTDHSARASATVVARRLPGIVKQLLTSGTPEVIKAASEGWHNLMREWLSVTDDAKSFVDVVMHPDFDASERAAVYSQTATMLDLTEEDEEPTDPRRRFRERATEVLDLLPQPSDDEVISQALRTEGYLAERRHRAGEVIARAVSLLRERPAILLERWNEFADPSNRGSMHIVAGAKEAFDADVLRELLQRSQRGAGMHLVQAVLGWKERSELATAIAIAEADAVSDKDIRWSLSVRFMLGPEHFYREATAALLSGQVELDELPFSWVPKGHFAHQDFRGFISAIEQKLSSSERTRRAAIRMAEELAWDDALSGLFADFMLAAFLATTPDEAQHDEAWTQIGTVLLRYDPDKVIAHASKFDQHDFDPATRVLEAAVESQPQAVLNSIVDRIREPFDEVITLPSAFRSLLTKVAFEDFKTWLATLDEKSLTGLSSHLPRPFHDGSGAVVPVITREFWERISPESPIYEHCYESFFVSTLGTEVFGGFGVDLFSDRVTLAKALLGDPQPAIRSWARDFLEHSNRSLSEAIKRRDLHDVRLDLES